LITVDSELGKGTAFYIYLPASSEKKVKEEKPLPEIAEGEGKVLVMDDEDIVLESTSELLEEIGFTVETALDGFEAIELYKEAMQANQPFDLVILDLIVPGGLGGQETIRRLLEIDPKIKAVVSSGYSTNPVIAKHKEYGFAGAITKPFRIKELSAVLQKVLGGSAK
jgi:CheY-like chemotaxis protein